ncbi:MAG TPA: tripartite tricarboxylate transporter TctB family protein [Burkholderiaceae bacterium]|jgi:hypothetical protein
MKIKSLRDFLSGLMFMIIGVAFAVGSTNYALGDSAQPGAGFFPLVLSVLLTVLGAIVLFKSLTIETEGGDPIGVIAWRPLIAIVGGVALFGVSIKPLGLLLAVPIVVLLAHVAARGFKWAAALAGAAVLTLSSWAIFVLGLKLAIPLWPSF